MTAGRCEKPRCRGMLRIASDHLGNVAVICDWCERKRAGICRDCPSPLVPDTLGRNNSPRCLECAVRQRIESSRRFARIQYREHRKKLLARKRAKPRTEADRARQREKSRRWRELHPRDDFDRAYFRAWAKARRADPAYRARQNELRRKRERAA